MNAEELRNYPKLGFGLMRLPRKGLKTDIEQTKQMVDLFLESASAISIPPMSTRARKRPPAKPW